MKTYTQFCTESYSARENVQEALPLAIPIAMKVGSMALGAYSAYRAAKDLKKGNYKGAALNALGVLPAGGTAFKAARALGAGRNLAKGASAVQSVARHSSPARNQVYTSAGNTGTNVVKNVVKGYQKANQNTQVRTGY